MGSQIQTGECWLPGEGPREPLAPVGRPSEQPEHWHSNEAHCPLTLSLSLSLPCLPRGLIAISPLEGILWGQKEMSQ